MTGSNLNLSLCFDEAKKFLICGELVKFYLKITSPDFETIPPESFLERIGASVESIEIVSEEPGSLLDSSILSTTSSSIDSIKGRRKMKSVESLSNLLRAADQPSPSRTQSKDSQQSMSSVTARRFNSLSVRSKSKPFWNEAIFIPLEVFIDPEGFPSSHHKATVKIKVVLNELVPIDALEALRLGFSEFKWTDSVSSAAQSSHKLEKIGSTEISLTVLRPLEVSLRTHNFSPNRVILQIIIEFNHGNEAEELNGNLEIDSCEIVLSDSFTSRKNSNLFKITPLSDKQVPFVFETSPQQYSLLFNWTLLEQSTTFDENLQNLHLRVELGGKLKSKTVEMTSELSLSFESSVPIFNLFPAPSISGIKITSTKLITKNPLKVFEPFQIEIILHNFDNELLSLQLNVKQLIKQETCNKSHSNEVEKWFCLEREKRSPGVLIMSPLTPLNIENIPPNGSKAIRLKLLPMKRGIFDLKEDFKIVNNLNGKTMKFDQIVIKVE